jgi:two-component system OmpR family sensor kinase
LLDATRLQYGKYTLRLERVDLKHLIVQTIADVHLTTPHPPIQFDPPGTPLVIQADAGRLQQILLNLLTNALTHAAASERIDVRLRRGEQSVILKVQDHGQGIAAQHLPHLFERFYQGAGNQRSEGEGLGLGLYITKELVLAHGGRITVESAEGQGTLFTLTFPMLADESPADGDERGSTGR